MAPAPIKAGVMQFSDSLITEQTPQNPSDSVDRKDSKDSSRHGPRSMSRSQSNNYTTDSTHGNEYQDCYSAIPRFCNDPYEQYLQAQSAMHLQRHALDSNYTTKTEHREETSINDLADHLEAIKIEPDQLNKPKQEGDVGERLDSLAKAKAPDDVLPLSGSGVKKEENETSNSLPSQAPTSNNDSLDESRMEALIEPVLADTTQHLMDSTMGYFRSVALGQTQFNQYGNHQEGSSSQSTSGTYLDSNNSKQADSSSNHSKGQSAGSGKQEGRGHDDDEESKRPRKRKRGSNPAAMYQEKKLACPYFKHSPGGPYQQRACSGPGFRDIHRLKYNARLSNHKL
jgi:hypothetical protein